MMTSLERRGVLSLSLILSLRMLGLFMVIPVFTLYATHLTGATPVLTGLAIGIYGLTQMLFQIPFGTTSDYIGRKKIITMGLLLFASGSVIAATAHTIYAMLVGRALQGAGAIGSTVMASIADLTHEQNRTKAMAMAGMSIGSAFSLAMILGPLFALWVNVNGIFWIASALSVLAIFILFYAVPTIPHAPPIRSSTSLFQQWKTLMKESDLSSIHLSVLLLHAIFTASFVVLPISLHTMAGLSSQTQWMFYCPILIFAFIFSIPCIIIGEKKHCFKELMMAAIALLGGSEFLFWYFSSHLLISAASLLLFFTAFSLFEAFLPSLISRMVPPTQKGCALGIYSSSQFFGIFIGGMLGGWLYGKFGPAYVYLFCATVSFIWFIQIARMKKPQHAFYAQKMKSSCATTGSG